MQPDPEGGESDAGKWSREEAARIGRRIARRRAQLRPRLSARALAERTTALGCTVSRSTLAKLESGVREDLTIAELRVLAAALEMPPALLLNPLDDDEPVAPLPGASTDPWIGYQAFSGDTVWVFDRARPSDAVEARPSHVARGKDPIVDMFRRHERSADEVHRTHRYDPGRAEGFADALVAVRNQMMAGGVTPPVLTPDVAAYLDSVAPSVPVDAEREGNR